jgi:hypothetical protein
LESEFEFAAEFFAVGKIELVFLDEELAIHLIGGVFDKQFVFVAGEDDADGWVVAFGVFLGGEVAEVEIRKAEGSAPGGRNSFHDRRDDCPTTENRLAV